MTCLFCEEEEREDSVCVCVNFPSDFGVGGGFLTSSTNLLVKFAMMVRKQMLKFIRAND